MDTSSDQELLRNYAEHRSQPAFEELVRRHVDLVYSAALRIVRRADAAEDVTQCAFTALAQNARRVAKHPILSGWLHLTTRNLAAKTVRSEVRRRAREEAAALVNRREADPTDAPWERVAQDLDGALGELSDADRVPLLLRYFERKSAREIGQTLGINEEAAQKRVARAVERLRALLVRRDVRIAAGALAVMLAAYAVQSAPPTLSAAAAGAAFSAAGPTAAASGSVRPLPRSAKPALAFGTSLAILGLAVVLCWQPRPEVVQRTPSNPTGTIAMKIQLTSVMVDDQDKARRFYTEVLGLVVKADMPAGGGVWLTVVSPDEPNGTEISLEPLGFPPAITYQEKLFQAGIPFTALAVGDVRSEYERMRKLGARFQVEPTAAGPATIAVFDDTCGNLIQLTQAPADRGAEAPFRVRIRQSKVMVKDQDRALKFYTEVLGFVKKRDLAAGGGRWLTVVSPDALDGTELVLDPMSFPPARTFQEALRGAGIPHTAFAVGDVQRAYERLKERGVEFTMTPAKEGPTTIAFFDDTCGNVIMIFDQ